MKKKQQGLYLVEFAITAVVTFIILFAVIELARIIWIWNTADEATRRGARVAAVCPANDDAIAQVTVFADLGSDESQIIKGLTTGNVVVEYFNENGTEITAGNEAFYFENTRYVRVSLIDFYVEPLIPFVGDIRFDLPAFEATLPAESLGFVPNPDDPSASYFDCLMP
jgi:hypothetical protein